MTTNANAPDVREITGEELAALQAQWRAFASSVASVKVDHGYNTTKGDDLGEGDDVAEDLAAQARWRAQHACELLVSQEPPLDCLATKGQDRRPGESRSRLQMAGLGEVEPSKRRKPGRPRIVAWFFPKLAEAMADGTSLKTALAMCGIRNLGASETRGLYRNTTFRAMYQQARQRFLLEHFGKKPTLRAKLGRYV